MKNEMQLGLFDHPKNNQRALQPEQLESLIRTLAGRGWLTRKQLERETDYSDRTIRALANASDGQIISGQQGYRLTREATLDEIKHAAGWLKHQAAEMQRRAIQIERVRHN
jgi:hypothetical protein